MTHWVKKAWEILFKNYKDMIIKTFRNVGLFLQLDGLENDQIKVKDILELVVRDYNLMAIIDFIIKEAVIAFIEPEPAVADEIIIVEELIYIIVKEAFTGEVDIAKRKAFFNFNSEIKEQFFNDEDSEFNKD